MVRVNDNVAQFVEHVSTDLTRRFPAAKALLSLWWSSETKHRGFSGSFADLCPHLGAFCGNFPTALTRYDPEHPYGMVCQISCHCGETHAGSPSKCYESEKHYRPHAVLILVKNGADEIPVGRCCPPTGERA